MPIESERPVYKICRDCKLSPSLLFNSFRTALRSNGLNRPRLVTQEDHDLLEQFIMKKKITKSEDHVKLSRMAIATTSFWGLSPVITVSFMGGDKIVKERITEHAKTWMDHAGIELKFLKSPKKPTDIRISFDTTDGSWSYVGTDCKHIHISKPTMNYGWLYRDTADAEYRRTVLHEFGHAIGCIHEHQMPALKIPWNKPMVYAYYRRQGWSPEDVDQQVFEKYDGSLMNGSAVDTKSIMMYAIPKELTNGGYEVKWNNKLSANDKKIVKEIYPQ